MLRDREELDTYLAKLRSKDGINLQAIYDELEEKYNIPIYFSSDILTGKKEFAEVNKVQAFCFLSVMKPDMVSSYFTEKEINDYSKAKQKYKKAKLPIIFDEMVQINDNQWIGHSSIQQLMQLKDALLINYNPETQRPMRRFVNGNDELYRISVSWSAVSEIENLIREGNYIADDITLNIPDGAIFVYKDQKIIISEISKLDIIDGYHRYLAFARIYNENPDFDMQIELRITSFSVQRSQQYIWQKDQKTKMTKIDSQSFNQFDSANVICERLNQDILFNLQGCITRNDSIIKLQQLAILIDYFYVKKYSTKEIRTKMVETTKIIRDKFNIITSQDEEYMTKPYDFKKLFTVIYVFASDVTNSEMLDAIRYCAPRVRELDNKLFNPDKIRAKLINETNKIFDEWRTGNVL